MIKQLLYKWFNLNDSCEACEVLRAELDYVKRQNETLLNRILNPEPKIEQTITVPEEIKPVSASGGRRFVPYAVRQQMMEREDEQSLKVMQEFQKKRQEAEKEVLAAKTEKEEEKQVNA